MRTQEEVSHITTSAYSMQCSGSRGLVTRVTRDNASRMYLSHDLTTHPKKAEQRLSDGAERVVHLTNTVTKHSFKANYG